MVRSSSFSADRHAKSRHLDKRLLCTIELVDRQVSPRGKSGFSLSELLVSLSIVAVLVSLLAPSVLKSRESARRFECSVRLSSIGKALHGYHDSHGAFPSAVHSLVAPAYPLMFSPLSQVLPYLDQSAISKTINRQETGSGVYPAPPNSAINGNLLHVSLPSFVCPSDGIRAGSENYRVCLGSDYYTVQRLTNGGIFSSRRNQSRGGTLSAVSDGISNTALCSEKIVGDWDDLVFTPERDIYFVPPLAPGGVGVDQFVSLCQSSAPSSTQHNSYGGATWVFNGFVFTWYNHVLTPNSPLPDCTEADPIGGGRSSGIYTARSWHSNGVNLLLGDCSVRFINTAIGKDVWRALGTRRGGENIAAL